MLLSLQFVLSHALAWTMPPWRAGLPWRTQAHEQESVPGPADARGRPADACGRIRARLHAPPNIAFQSTLYSADSRAPACSARPAPSAPLRLGAHRCQMPGAAVRTGCRQLRSEPATCTTPERRGNEQANSKFTASRSLHKLAASRLLARHPLMTAASTAAAYTVGRTCCHSPGCLHRGAQILTFPSGRTSCHSPVGADLADLDPGCLHLWAQIWIRQ